MAFFFHIVILNYTPVLLILGFILYLCTYHTINVYSNLTEVTFFESEHRKNKDIRKLILVINTAVFLNYIYFALLVIFGTIFINDWEATIAIFLFYFVLFVIIIGQEVDFNYIFKKLYAKIRRKPFLSVGHMTDEEFKKHIENNNKFSYILSLIFLFINIYCTYIILLIHF